MTQAGRAPELMQGADAAVARGDLAGAAQLIDQALAMTDLGFAAWLKLAGLRRGLRQPHRALDAVHRALAHAPLNFIALALRAGLLEKLEPARAGEAWAEALAQRPPGELPPGMADAVSAGDALRAAWLAGRGARCGVERAARLLPNAGRPRALARRMQAGRGNARAGRRGSAAIFRK